MNDSFYVGSRAQNSVEKGCFSWNFSNFLVASRCGTASPSSCEKFWLNQTFVHKAIIHFSLFLIFVSTILLLLEVAGAFFIE